MSVEALSWAFQQDVTPAAKKLVLIALANRADEDGYCFPGYEKLALQCSIDRRSVIRHVKDLQEQGFITVSSRTRENGSDTSNLYKLALKGWGDRLSPLGCQIVTPEGDRLSPPYTNNNIQHTHTALTRSDFLREIEKARTEGRFKSQTENEIIITAEAEACWEYWETYPDKKPTGSLVTGFSRFLRQSRAIKAAEKLADKSKASSGGEGVTLAQASQPWHVNIARKVGEAPARAWIYPLHHDGEQIVCPSALHRERVIRDYRTEIEAEFRRGIPIVVGQIPQEQSA